MDTIAKKFAQQIEKEYKIDIADFILVENNMIICRNSAIFDFEIVFINNFWKSNISNCNLYSPIGTSEDNNLMTTKIIREILHNCYCVYHGDKYIIKTF